MLWLLIASILFSFTSYLLLTNKELSLLDQTELLWLLSKVIVGVGLLVDTIDASSSITSEFERETAETLFVAPLSLRDMVIGKLLASLTLWFSIFIVSIPYILVTSAGSQLALPFLEYVLILGTLGNVSFIFFIFSVSLLFRSSKNTLTTSLILLLGLTVPALFSTTLKSDVVSQVFARFNPIDNIFAALDYVLVDYKISLLDNWQYLFPLLAFCALTGGFLVFAMQRFEKRGVIISE